MVVWCRDHAERGNISSFLLWFSVYNTKTLTWWHHFNSKTCDLQNSASSGNWEIAELQLTPAVALSPAVSPHPHHGNGHCDKGSMSPGCGSPAPRRGGGACQPRACHCLLSLLALPAVPPVTRQASPIKQKTFANTLPPCWASLHSTWHDFPAFFWNTHISSKAERCDTHLESFSHWSIKLHRRLQNQGHI